MRYRTFGGTRFSTGSLPTDRLFTGQIRDLGDDRFYFFKSRYYDATIGKFHTPDTIVPDPKNPQLLNRYAYALNNPLKFADPTGHVVVFVGGYGTDLNWDRAEFAKLEPGLIKLGLLPANPKEGKDYNFYDWNGDNSATANPAAHVWDLAQDLQGMKDVTLIGHSKGGNLVLDYAEQLAGGGVPRNKEIRNIIALDAPLNSPVGVVGQLLGFGTSMDVGSLAGLQNRLLSRGYAARVFNVYDPRDVISGGAWGARIPGVTNVAYDFGTGSGALPQIGLSPPSFYFPANHTASLSPALADALAPYFTGYISV